MNYYEWRQSTMKKPTQPLASIAGLPIKDYDVDIKNTKN